MQEMMRCVDQLHDNPSNGYFFFFFSLTLHQDPGAGAGPLASERLRGDSDGATRWISSDREPSGPR